MGKSVKICDLEFTHGHAMLHFLHSQVLALALHLTPDLGQRDHGVHIRESPCKGFGAFAARPFAQRATVGDYTGEMLSVARHEARYGSKEGWSAEDDAWLQSRQARKVSVSGDYVVRVNDTLVIDAEDPDVSSWCRFINHDPAPNLALKVLPKGIDGKPRVWFVTMRPVAAGDELCFDYGPDFWDPELDGVSSSHNERVESTLLASPWYANAASAESVPAAAAPASAAVEDFAFLEGKLLTDLIAWHQSAPAPYP